MKKNWKLVLTVALAVLAIVVVLQNTAPVRTQILFSAVEMPHALLLLSTLGVGVLIGLFLGFRMRRSERRQES